jgi:hypothetical protein
VFLSLCYVVLRRILQLAVLHVRSNDFKDLEIVLLRHELGILRRRIRRPAITWIDRLFSWPLAGSCRVPAGGRSSSLRGRCLAGIGAWWRSGGRTRVEPGARRSAARSERWSSVSRVTTRGGVINASSAN